MPNVLRRAALAGARFAFEPRLSVLKFPSGFFRPYARAGHPPEAPYLADMQRDPLGIERRVLTDLAIVAARHPLQYYGRLESHRQLLRRTLLVSFRRLAVDPFRESPVVAQLLRRRYPRLWRGQRRVRGLD